MNNRKFSCFTVVARIVIVIVVSINVSYLIIVVVSMPTGNTFVIRFYALTCTHTHTHHLKDKQFRPSSGARRQHLATQRRNPGSSHAAGQYEPHTAGHSLHRALHGWRHRHGNCPAWELHPVGGGLIKTTAALSVGGDDHSYQPYARGIWSILG